MNLYQELKKYAQTDWLPMHMPGHKRRKELGGWLPYEEDITEIDGFDNLHHREGILKELAERMSRLRHSGMSIPLVNGSTAGILAAIYAMTGQGDTVLMARGCHKAVYHAVELRALDAVYLHAPEGEDGFFLSIQPKQVEEALKLHPQIKLVILTSPTYEGVVSDIQTIAKLVHKHGARLLVDGAHGAHFGYTEENQEKNQKERGGLHPCFPKDALNCGADVVVESLHKTLPAMTQTAVLHLAEGVEQAPFEHALDIFETSSPSYVLLASIDRCVSILEEKRKELFAKYTLALMQFDRAVRILSCLYIPGHSEPMQEGAFSYDPGKIIVCAGRTGEAAPQIAAKLREKYHIEPEMVCPDYFLCMTSPADTNETLQRLAEALLALDREYAAETCENRALDGEKQQNSKMVVEAGSTKEFRQKKLEPEVGMSIAKALHRGMVCRGKTQYLQEQDAIGRIALEYVWAYPPGIPLLAPGELVTEGTLSEIQYRRSAGIKLQVGGRADDGRLKVLG